MPTFDSFFESSRRRNTPRRAGYPRRSMARQAWSSIVYSLIPDTEAQRDILHYAIYFIIRPVYFCDTWYHIIPYERNGVLWYAGSVVRFCDIISISPVRPPSYLMAIV